MAHFPCPGRGKLDEIVGYLHRPDDALTCQSCGAQISRHDADYAALIAGQTPAWTQPSEPRLILHAFSMDTLQRLAAVCKCYGTLFR